MKNSIRRIKSILRKSPFIYKLNCIIKEKTSTNRYSLAEKGSELCIEAYPSSANSFLYYYIRYVNKEFKIAHHTHTVANIKLALRNDIPTYVIIRNPIDAISSNLSRFNTDVKCAILDYTEFYEYCLANVSSLTVLSFEEVVGNPSEVVNMIFENMGMPERLEKDYTEEVKAFMKEIEPNKDKLSLPNQNRNDEKSALKLEIENSTEFLKAKKVYEDLIKSIKG